MYPDPLPQEEIDRLASLGTLEARNTIVLHNMPYVVSVADKINRIAPRHSRDDMIQAGAFGLIRAAEKYTPGRNAFITYADRWIRQTIARHNARDRMTPTPIHIYAILPKIHKYARKNRVGYGAACDDLGVTGPTKESVELAFRQNMEVSIDERVAKANDGSRWPEWLTTQPDALDELERHEKQIAVHIALSSLKRRDMEMVMHAYELCGKEFMSRKELCKKYNISRERVKQIINKSLDTIGEIVRQWDI